MLCISDKDQLQSSQCNGLVGLLCPIVFHVVGGQRQFISQSKINAFLLLHILNLKEFLCFIRILCLCSAVHKMETLH